MCISSIPIYIPGSCKTPYTNYFHIKELERIEKQKKEEDIQVKAWDKKHGKKINS